jgi:multisubunit Na+/H+ antiporter MnhC subunit
MYTFIVFIAVTLIGLGVYMLIFYRNIITVFGVAIFGHGVNLLILSFSECQFCVFPFKSNISSENVVSVNQLQNGAAITLESAIQSNLLQMPQQIATNLANPLPQALVLTAIVIGLAFFALLLLLLTNKMRQK